LRSNRCHETTMRFSFITHHLPLTIILFLFSYNAFAQPDSGFTNKAEAKNLKVNGLKEGKWCEYSNAIPSYEPRIAGHPAFSNYLPFDFLDTVTVLLDSNSANFYTLTIYKKGVPIGTVRDYFTVSYLVRIGKYGKDMCFSKYPIAEVPYKRGKISGLVKKYWPDGKLRYEIPYRRDMITGTVRIYDKNGKLESTMRYRRDNWIMPKGDKDEVN